MFGARIDRISERLAAEGLDALLVSSLPNIFYLSGFTGSTALLLIGREARWFITDFRYHTQFGLEVDKSYKLADNSGKQLVRDVLPALGGGLRRIGFEADHTSYNSGLKFAAAEGCDFVPTSGWIEDLRIVKSAEEIELIRAAVLLNEVIFREVLGCIGPDATEKDLAAEIYFRALKHGAGGVSFDPIVASGPNSAKPHARAGSDKLVPGAPLTFDMGMKLNGYCSDMTRTVFYKDCPPKWEAIYNIVHEAKEAAHAAIRPGKLGKEVDAAARDHIIAAGYGELFGHGLGHGVGIEVHEAPRLAKVGELALAPGHVVTNEPGIYLPGEGGIRIEDMELVTDGGAEVLNTLPTGIEVAG